MHVSGQKIPEKLDMHEKRQARKVCSDQICDGSHEFIVKIN